MSAAPLAQRAEQFRQDFARLELEIGKIIVGQPEIVRGVLACVFVGGHVLLEGVPGLGKTLLVRTLASVLDLKFAHPVHARLDAFRHPRDEHHLRSS